jgi:hypothetical protein
VAAILALAVLALTGVDIASATSFCVPSFSSACPNNGVNVAEADLEKAMGTNAGDGVADSIVLAPGVISEDGAYEPPSGFKNPGSIEPAGTDPLMVTGAGAGTSIVTSAGTGNIFLLAMGSAARPITLRALTLRAPAGFADGGGSVVQLSTADTLEDVAVVSLNQECDGITAGGSGNLVRDVEVRGEGAGSILFGITSGSAGDLTVEDTLIEGASWGLSSSAAGGVLTARRVREVGTRTYGAIATDGSLHLENSVFAIDDGIGLYASAASSDSTLTADQVTIVNGGGTAYPAMELTKLGPSAGDMALTVSNSILRGFGAGYRVNTVLGPGVGTATLTARYSNFQKFGTSNGQLDISTGNIDADPLLGGDYSLPPSSPSIDAGDPAAGGLPTDFLGAPRPNDGNGNGTAVRDQGAFEYQRPAPPSGGGGGGEPEIEVVIDRPADTFITRGPGKKLAQGKARFAFRSDLPNPRFQCKLDRRKAGPCRSPKLYKGLKPGRHVFTVWATAGFGKDPTPAKKRFRVPAN